MIYRELKPDEYELLKTFTYEAVFIPEGAEPPDRSILELPELSAQKANYAARMYRQAGFKSISESDEEYIIVCGLSEPEI